MPGECLGADTFKWRMSCVNLPVVWLLFAEHYAMATGSANLSFAYPYMFSCKYTYFDVYVDSERRSWQYLFR